MPHVTEPAGPLRPRANINASARVRVRTTTPRPTLRARVNVPPPSSARVNPPAPSVAVSPPTSALNAASSPPASALSFSSRSDDDRATPPNNHARDKSNRKIADLEITNRSLLAINASLESTKHKQAKEIRDLRRRLRESRLVPPAPAAVDDPAPTDDSDDDNYDDDDVFTRIKSMLDNLLQSGRSALQTQPRDFLPPTSSTRVLSADEVRSWTQQEDNPFQTHLGDQSQTHEDDQSQTHEDDPFQTPNILLVPPIPTP
ncbi:hypothetical protein C0992_002441 [Termitomyces sp. T32_za158]|nr:hypothetical protein C0992_002441 [Termitomyces sp. T32_za158]